MTSSIDFYVSKYGQFPFNNDDEFQVFLQDLKKETDRDADFYFEQYPYGIIMDTTSMSYIFYSYGPNKSYDDLEYTPFGNKEGQWFFSPSKIDFFSYLFMDDNYDIVLNQRNLGKYDCSKRQSEVFSVLLKENPDDSKELINGFFKELKRKSSELRDSFDSENIKFYSSNPIFRYQDNTIDVLCDNQIDTNTINEIKNTLIEELNNYYLDRIEIATFYIDLKGNEGNVVK